MTLQILAFKKGFKTQSSGLAYLMELKNWLINVHGLYVQEQCFNTHNWGFRIYALTGDREVGAPIVFEEDEANHSTCIVALATGLIQAISMLEDNE